MNVLAGNVGKEYHADVERTQQGFDTTDSESTRMHVGLSCRHGCAVDPSLGVGSWQGRRWRIDA